MTATLPRTKVRLSKDYPKSLRVRRKLCKISTRKFLEKVSLIRFKNTIRLF